MSIGMVFWLFWVLSLFFWGAVGRPWDQPNYGWGSGLLLHILTGLLGWHDFGFVIHP
jgi:hypothetical protein